MTFQQIVSEININIAKYKAKLSYQGYYIGVSSSESGEIYKKHNLSPNADWYIVLPVDNLETASEVVSYFGLLGMTVCDKQSIVDGERPLYIYCYEITINTKE